MTIAQDEGAELENMGPGAVMQSRTMAWNMAESEAGHHKPKERLGETYSSKCFSCLGFP